MKSFLDCYGAVPSATGIAAGRVNLLGEHTDYNDGFVMPALVPQRTRVAIGLSRHPFTTLYSANLDEMARWTLDMPPEEMFARYVYGCIAEAHVGRGTPPPLNIHVASDVPMGVGLSSSAALEVATLRALRTLLGWSIDDVEIARLGQRAEIRHAGVNCGILDQMACSILTEGFMLYLDTRTLERQTLPLPPGSELLVVDSGLPRSLATSKYNERRAECESAAHILGARTLRDIDDASAIDTLPEPLRKRARHVVTENDRVQRARTADAETFGRLMSASHASLSSDYEVSTPELDRLVGLLHEEPAIHGAKLTGAGFGGACVALCREGRAAEAGHRVIARYNALGSNGALLIPAAPDSNTGKPA